MKKISILLLCLFPFSLRLFASESALVHETLSVNLQNVGTRTSGNQKTPESPKKEQITGTIKDQNGQPIKGAIVSERNFPENATTTDSGGNFRLEVSEGAMLRIYMFGYEGQTINTKGENTFSITLNDELQSLDEVVVIAYGSQERKDLTGAVSTVNMEDLAKSTDGSFLSALAGRVAGLQITSADGQPGEALDITMRGTSSLTQSNSPLYVIDGFPLEDIEQNMISANDIASITILKDASSTAIYGARAANGVVIIETKKGQLGKPVITFNSSVGISKVTRTMELMSPYEFVKFQMEKGTFDTSVYFENGKTLDSYKNKKGLDLQDYILKTAVMQKYDIAIRGGSTDTKYSLSGSMYDQTGIVLNTGSVRYSGNMILEQALSKKLKIRGQMRYTHVTNRGTNVTTGGIYDGDITMSDYLFFNAWSYRPVSGNDEISLLDLDIDPLSDGTRYNPLRSLENDYVRRIYEYITGNVMLNYAINPALTLNVRGNISRNNVTVKQFYNSKTNRGRDRIDNMRKVNGRLYNGQGTILSNESTVTYRKKFNKCHSLTALAGMSINTNTNTSFGYWAEKVPNDALGISGLDEGIPFNITSTSTENRLLSFFGRINYGYRSKYLVTTTFRADGSSKFARGNKWGYFPSAALAWNMHEENFMKSVKSVVSQSKLRLSYGLTGNNRVGDFSYLPKELTSSYESSYSFNNDTPGISARSSSMGNSALTWETTAQTNIGIDLGLLRNRIQLTVDCYQKITRDLLLLANMPLSSGFSATYMNVGKTRNRGVEIELQTTNIKTKSFEWTSAFNISINRNKVLKLVNEDELYSFVSWQGSYSSIPAYITMEGQAMGLMWGFIHDGNYQYEDFDYDQVTGKYTLKDDVTTNGKERNSIQPGDIKYLDLNGDLVVNSEDRTIIGSPWPKHTGGFVNNLSWKNFSLNIFFQWSYGNQILNANRYLLEGDASNYPFPINQFASYTDRWTPDNPTNGNHRVNGQGPYAYSSRVIEDGSFLRLKTLSLGYNLPKPLLDKMKIRQMRIVVSADNLFVVTGYSGLDPEVSVRNTALTKGFDFSAYPRAVTITCGLDLTF